MMILGQESTKHVYLLNVNDCETGRVLQGKFRSTIQMLLTIHIYIILYIFYMYNLYYIYIIRDSKTPSGRTVYHGMKLGESWTAYPNSLSAQVSDSESINSG